MGGYGCSEWGVGKRGEGYNLVKQSEHNVAQSMGIFCDLYFSTPAESDSGPFGDCSFSFLVDLFKDAWNLLLGLSTIPIACKVRSKSLLLFFRVSWDPVRTGMLALKQVRDKNLVLVGADATMGKEIGALDPIGW